MESPKHRFETPEAELQYLRQQVKSLSGGNEERAPQAADAVVSAYKAIAPEQVVHDEMQSPESIVQKLALDLAPEPHDFQMNELYEMVQESGIKNALSVVEKMNSPHISDDFHRFLVALVKSNGSLSGIKEGGPVFRALHMTLFEIVLPREMQEETRGLKEIISSMEQFYAGMLSVADKENVGQQYFTLELAIPNYEDHFTFFVSVPTDKKELFEKQLLSVFPDVQMSERVNDYNVFSDSGATLSSVATLTENPILPLATYESFDHDPLNAIVNSFSKIDREGEGAAIQIVFNPKGGDVTLKKFKSALQKLQDGTPKKEVFASVAQGAAHDIARGLGDFFKNSKKKEDKDESDKKIDQSLIEQVQKKTESGIVMTNIRLVASSRTEGEADAILDDMEAAFNQFANTHGNSLKFKRTKGNANKGLLKNFSFRMFSSGDALPLNMRELTTLFHFQNQALKGRDQLKTSNSHTAPAPILLPTDGVMIGINKHQGAEKEIRISPDDRLRHTYVIGQTGTGKSTMLKNMIIQDIKAGEGVCFIDPHGADIQDILAAVPPERYEDVIYFDPSHVERPMGLNMLEYNPAFPEQKTFVVNELFGIFQKLYGGVPESMGPMFEQYFRNATMLVIEDPESGNTLLDVSRVLADKGYRDYKLSKCNNPVVKQFWQEVAEKAGGEAALSNIVPYITSKFDVFLANDIMRPIVAQQKSAFNFREIMDGKKILLVNLAKGRLGDINSNLLGLIIVGKFLMASLSRVDSFGKDLPPFYLYIDEFQNVTTNSISSILSEARKYKLSLTVAHQFIAQLEDDIRDSVFGNVGSMIAFRVGSEDGEFLEKQFAPTFTADDLMNIDNRNAAAKILVNGRPEKPFNIETVAPDISDPSKVEKLKELSYLTYGRARADVEEAVNARYNK